MNKHTPGPWNVGPHPGAGYGTDWRTVVSDIKPFGETYICNALKDDARLIAAAPELLEQIQYAVTLAKTGVLHQSSLDKVGLVELFEQIIEAASPVIAKAEGKL